MVDTEKLARAVLLFHSGGEWTQADRETWLELTGSVDASTLTLCNLARATAELGGTQLLGAAAAAQAAELEIVHRVLFAAWEAIVRLRPRLLNTRADVAFAVGEAGGALNKAKALVGREIDLLRAQA